jgi:ribosomal protein S12 methylthiotransferase accessory factor YcaO
MSLILILPQEHLTWKHANTTLSGQTDLSINGSAVVRPPTTSQQYAPNALQITSRI